MAQQLAGQHLATAIARAVMVPVRVRLVGGQDIHLVDEAADELGVQVERDGKRDVRADDRADGVHEIGLGVLAAPGNHRTV